MNAANSGSHIAALVEGLAEQKRLYVDMEVLAARQKAILEADDHAALARLLAEKQAILAQVGAAETRIAEAKLRWKDLRERIDAERRAEVERLVEEVGAVLQRLMALEAEGHAMLQARRRRTAEELQTLWKTKRIPGAYGPAPKGPGEPRFFDNNR